MISRIQPFFPAILVLFHSIGLILFLQSDSASDLTWMNLMLCGTLVFLAEPLRIKSALIAFIIILGGFLIELIGTKTGYLFGDYAYGASLGWRLFGVSVIIGVNWYAIVLASSNIARFLKVNVFLQAVVAGTLCVGLDVVIEPVAIKYGFWTWANGEIPLFNYITWFFFSVFFSLLYLKSSPLINKTAAWLYAIWLLFFGILILM